MPASIPAWVVVVIVLVAQPAVTFAQELRVAAAASLREALQDISQAFQKDHRLKVTLSFAGSGQLMLQIRQGAPVDVFISAALEPVTTLQREQLLTDDEPVIIARNQLVLMTPPENPGGVQRWKDLAAPTVRRIAVGNPSTVPAGAYAMQIFKEEGILDDIREKLVFCPDVRMVSAAVAKDLLDAGVVYQSDTFVPSDAVIAKHWFRVVDTGPDAMKNDIVYPAVIVRGRKHTAASREFVRFLTGPQSQRILGKYRFIPVLDDAANPTTQPATAPAAP